MTSSRPSTAHALALVSGVVGLAAGAFLIGFFALESYGVRPGGVSLGTVNDVLGVVQLATLAPVAWALRQRLPSTRAVHIATVAAVAAMITFAVLGVLLVAGVLTFAAQIGPVIVTIVAIYGWLVAVNLTAHRTRTLPRVVTRTGLLLGLGLLLALVLVGAGYGLPGFAGRLVSWTGYGLGGAAWLGLPAYALLLATRVFTRTDPSAAPAGSHRPHGASRS